MGLYSSISAWEQKIKCGDLHLSENGIFQKEQDQ